MSFIIETNITKDKGIAYVGYPPVVDI